MTRTQCVMKKLLLKLPVAVVAASCVLALAACGSDDSDKSSSATSSQATTSAAATSSGKAESTTKAKPTSTEGANETIADYIAQNGITETPVKPDDPNAPTIDLPFPAGWENAGANTPEWAYAAIVYSGADAGNYQPSIIALLSKLEGNVDQEKLIEYAGGELKNLPDYTEVQPETKSTFSGFPSLAIAGTHSEGGQEILAAQKTVVIEGKDGIYVLQLNLDATPDQAAIVNAAAEEINTKTTITP